MDDTIKPVRSVIKWPPGLLEAARAAGGGERLSAFATRCAIAVQTDPERAAVRELADELSRLAAQQVTIGNRARLLRGRLETDPSVADELAATEQDLVPFEPGSVHIMAEHLEAVSAAAAAAGFQRHDQAAVMGNPNAGQGRSFTAFLRAAVALELTQRMALADEEG